MLWAVSGAYCTMPCDGCNDGKQWVSVFNYQDGPVRVMQAAGSIAIIAACFWVTVNVLNQLSSLVEPYRDAFTYFSLGTQACV